MPRFEPFAGLRYDLTTLGRLGFGLSHVVCPPYDVIGEEERGRLATRSPYNAVHVELPQAADDLDAYETARRTWRAWQREGVIRPDDRPCFYGYRMQGPTTARSIARTTTGVIGALGLEPTGEGDILPHEQTLPKAKSDRLQVLRACQANLSPVWGLSLAGGLAKHAGTPLGAWSALDDEGVEHLCWPITDPAAIAAISSLVASRPVVIADGHHRYETALAYRAERRAARGDAPGDYDAILAFVVELSSDELAVRPIHRVVRLSGEGAEHALLAAFEHSLAPRKLRSFADPDGTGAGHRLSDPSVLAELLETMARRGGPALVLRDGAYLLEAPPRHPGPGGVEVDSALVEDALRGIEAETSYTADPSEALAAVGGGGATAAVLLRPASVEAIAKAAEARVRMPPKTTYFAPKPRTGMVFRAVLD